MSDVKFSCPACSQHIRCDDSLGGTQVECPACRAPMIVPGAGAVPPPPAPVAGCPACGKPVAADAVICTECGMNLRTGERMAAPSRASAPRMPVSVSRKSIDSGIPVWLWGIVGGLGLLCVAGWFSPGMATVYTVVSGLFSLVIGILVLIAAFKESVGQGFLTLCIPFYVLYFVYGRLEDTLLKVLFTVALISRVLGLVITFQGLAAAGQ